MQKITDVKSGIYILEIFAELPFNLSIKKFSEVDFHKGYYYYIGSAQKNFHHRIKRHLTRDKKIHWHVDHLTTITSNDIKRIFYSENKPKDFETDLAIEFSEFPDITIPAKGFGNSDDPKAESHLFYSKSQNHFNQFISRYQSMVLFTPSSNDTC